MDVAIYIVNAILMQLPVNIGYGANAAKSPNMGRFNHCDLKGDHGRGNNPPDSYHFKPHIRENLG